MSEAQRLALAWFVGVAMWPAVVLSVIAIDTATASTGYECRCGWSTGMRAALPAWLRWRWHRHVTRPLGRCRSVPR